jgi:hypothetical protein
MVQSSSASVGKDADKSGVFRGGSTAVPSFIHPTKTLCHELLQAVNKID